MPHRTAGIYIEATHATTIDLEIHGWVEEETLEPPVKGTNFFCLDVGFFLGGDGAGMNFQTQPLEMVSGLFVLMGEEILSKLLKTKNKKKGSFQPTDQRGHVGRTQTMGKFLKEVDMKYTTLPRS